MCNYGDILRTAIKVTNQALCQSRCLSYSIFISTECRTVLPLHLPAIPVSSECNEANGLLYGAALGGRWRRSSSSCVGTAV